MSKKSRNPKNYTQDYYEDYPQKGKKYGNGYTKTKTRLQKLSKSEPNLDLRNIT